jgi:hypothetical protein
MAFDLTGGSRPFRYYRYSVVTGGMLRIDHDGKAGLPGVMPKAHATL